MSHRAAEEHDRHRLLTFVDACVAIAVTLLLYGVAMVIGVLVPGVGFLALLALALALTAPATRGLRRVWPSA